MQHHSSSTHLGAVLVLHTLQLRLQLRRAVMVCLAGSEHVKPVQTGRVNQQCRAWCQGTVTVRRCSCTVMITRGRGAGHWFRSDDHSRLICHPVRSPRRKQAQPAEPGNGAIEVRRRRTRCNGTTAVLWCWMMAARNNVADPVIANTMKRRSKAAHYAVRCTHSI